MLNENLKTLREAKGLTQAGLGKITKATPKTVRNWEMGNTEPKVSELILIAKSLGVSIGELIGEEESEQNRLVERIKAAIEILDDQEMKSLSIMIEGLYLRHQSHKAKNSFSI